MKAYYVHTLYVMAVDEERAIDMYQIVTCCDRISWYVQKCHGPLRLQTVASPFLGGIHADLHGTFCHACIMCLVL